MNLQVFSIAFLALSRELQTIEPATMCCSENKRFQLYLAEIMENAGLLSMVLRSHSDVNINTVNSPDSHDAAQKM